MRFSPVFCVYLSHAFAKLRIGGAKQENIFCDTCRDSSRAIINKTIFFYIFLFFTFQYTFLHTQLVTFGGNVYKHHSATFHTTTSNIKEEGIIFIGHYVFLIR